MSNNNQSEPENVEGEETDNREAQVSEYKNNVIRALEELIERIKAGEIFEGRDED